MNSPVPTPSQGVISSPFAHGFEGWSPPAAEQVRTAIKEGLVVVDTNVLLNLYRYDRDVTQQWFQIFERLGSRLWIPHQVLVEFWKNRDHLAGHPISTQKAASDIRKERDKIVSSYTAWIRSQGLTQTPGHQDRVRALTDTIDSLLEEIDAADSLHAERFDSDPARDEVAVGLARLTSRPAGAVRVGEPFDEATLKSEQAEADRRYAESIPPGYMDDKNNDETTVGKSSSAKYGDYLLWRQTLNEAKARASSAGASWVVLITDDMKEDWWRKTASSDEDKRHIARPELVQEMGREASARYIQLTATSLLRHADALEITVSADAIRSAETVNEAADEWMEEDILYLDAPGSGVHARAQLNRRDDRIKVLNGSQARIEQTPTIPDHTKVKIAQLIDDGALVPDPKNEKAYVFTTDWVANSVSGAACVIRAASASGNVSWRTKENLSPPELRAARSSETTFNAEVEAES